MEGGNYGYFGVMLLKYLKDIIFLVEFNKERLMLRYLRSRLKFF